MASARRYLADMPAVTIEQRVQVRQAESQLLRDANDNAGALAVLELALKEHPDSPELLYDAAMVAEKLDRIDVAEQHLRRVVALKLDDAQALNALGYTLVDRTTRYDEGYALIEKALKLAPNDSFILDSMGWALFRLGRYPEAETYLRRAFNARPDAEIAAHPRGAGRRSRRRAGDLAVAAEDDAGQPDPARDRAPPRAVTPVRAPARRAAALPVAALPAVPRPRRCPWRCRRCPSPFDIAAGCPRRERSRRRAGFRVACGGPRPASTSPPRARIARGWSATRRQTSMAWCSLFAAFADWGVLRPGDARRRHSLPTRRRRRRPASWPGVERDGAGRVSVLRQQGWEIVYAYADAPPPARPARLVMRYPDSEPVEVRVVVDRWSLADARP